MERAKYYTEWDLIMFALYKTGHVGTISDAEYESRMAEIAKSNDKTVAELEEEYLGKYDLNNRIIGEYVYDLLSHDAYNVVSDLSTDFTEFSYLLEEPKDTGTSTPDTTNKAPGTSKPGNQNANDGSVDYIKIIGIGVIGLIILGVVVFCALTIVATAKQKKNTTDIVTDDSDDDEYEEDDEDEDDENDENDENKEDDDATEPEGEESDE